MRPSGIGARGDTDRVRAAGGAIYFNYRLRAFARLSAQNDFRSQEAACSPQAWATGAPLLYLRALALSWSSTGQKRSACQSRSGGSIDRLSPAAQSAPVHGSPTPSVQRIAPKRGRAVQSARSAWLFDLLSRGCRHSAIATRWRAASMSRAWELAHQRRPRTGGRRGPERADLALELPEGLCLKRSWRARRTCSPPLRGEVVVDGDMATPGNAAPAAVASRNGGRQLIAEQREDAPDPPLRNVLPGRVWRPGLQASAPYLKSIPDRAPLRAGLRLWSAPSRAALRAQLGSRGGDRLVVRVEQRSGGRAPEPVARCGQLVPKQPGRHLHEQLASATSTKTARASTRGRLHDSRKISPSAAPQHHSRSAPKPGQERSKNQRRGAAQADDAGVV